MATEMSGLPAEAVHRLAGIEGADLVLGVVSRQPGEGVAALIREMEKVVRVRFPDARAVVSVAGPLPAAGSADAPGAGAGGLPVVPVTEAAGPRPAGDVTGGAAAIRAFCQIGRALGGRAVLLVGGDLPVLSEDGVDRLLRPVWDGELDFVAPLYPRHVLDGTLTTCLLYPMTRALYGRAVRHAMPADAAISAALFDRLAEVPPRSAAARAAPLYLTTAAAASGARLGEAWLGARGATPRDERVDLGAIMTEVVGAAFALAERYEDQWREAGPATPPRRLGDSLPPPGAPLVNAARMVAVFRHGLRDLAPIWEQALQPDTLADLFPLADLAPEEFVFSPDLWARVVYDFLLAHRLRALHRDHLLKSLVPLYLGRLAGLVREAAGQTAAGQERLVERQARAFEQRKGELADRWR
jgi:hypothetical protein